MRTVKLKIIMLAGIIGVTCFSSVALGFIIGNSNFGAGGYNDFERKYDKPMAPYGASSYMAEEYHRDVVDYVEKADDYIKAANNDINMIKAARDKVREDEAAVIDEHNIFFRR